MKKIILSLATVFFVATAKAALMTTAPDYFVRVPIFLGGYEFGVTGLLLQAYTSDLDYAAAFSNANSLAGGSIKFVRPDYDFGYQVYVGYVMPCSSNNVRFTVTNFSQDYSEHVHTSGNNFIVPLTDLLPTSVTVPNVFADITILAPPAVTIPFTIPTFPNTLLVPLTTLPINYTTEVNANAHFRLNVLDLDFGQFIDIDNFFRIRFFGGVRYSKVRNNLNVLYTYKNKGPQEVVGTTTLPGLFIFDGTFPFLAAETTTVTVDINSQFSQNILQNSDFDGTGPRLGMEGSFYIGGGFGLVGSVSAALLVGQISGAISDELNGTFSAVVSDIDTISVVNTTLTFPTTTIVGPYSLVIGTVLGNSSLSEATSFDTPKETQVFPNLEAKLGINYTYQLKNCSSVTVELGYYVNHYFNAVQRLSDDFIFGSAAPNFKTLDADFSGPYLSLQLQL